MMRRIIKITLLLVLGLLCLAYLFLPTKTVEFSQQEIEEVVSNMLPYKIEKGLVTITVRTATLTFRSDNKVGIETSFDAKGLTLEGVGQTVIKTGIRYDRGRFYLSDLTQEDIRFEFSQNSKETISDVKSSLVNIFRREEGEAAESGDESKAERIERVNDYASQKLQSDAEDVLDHFLKSIPIYSLNDQGSKLWLAALALENVKISEGKVTAVLSFQVLIIRVAGAVLSILLVAFLVFGQFGVGIWMSNSDTDENPSS